MGFSTWLAFLTVSLAAAFTPGPGVLLAVSTASTAGPRRALFTSTGNALGVLVVAGVAVTGLGLLLQTSALAFEVLKLLGAGYLIYLGVRQWRRKAGPADDGASEAPRIAATRFGLFRRGLLVALTNPKAILFFTAIFPQFMQTGSTDFGRFMLLALTFVACTLASHLFYVVLAACVGHGMRGVAHGRWLNRVVGGVFISLGCALLTLTRRTA